MAGLESRGGGGGRLNEVQQNRAFMELVGAIERQFPVDEWTLGSVRVWPIARMHLYYGFFEHQFFANHPARAGLIKTADLPRVGRRIATSAWDYAKAFVTDFGNSQHRNRPHDAIFLNYQTYMTSLRGRWYSRVCDPFVEKLSAKGLSSLMLTGGYKYATPRFSKSRFIQPHLVVHRLKGMAGRRREGNSPPMLHELEHFAKASGLFAPSFAIIAPVERHARQIMGIAGYFRRLLAEVRPQIVFVTCWNGTESMACILACHEAGIPTVDIQHGSQEFNIGYDRWNCVPAEGYELLPTYFWCWSDTEASVIRAWAHRLPIHQPVVGGNVFLERWIAGDDDTVHAYDEVLAGLKKRNNCKIQILYTLNGSTKEEINTIISIIDAVNKSSLDAHFWIRLHPIALDQKRDVMKTLDAQGIRNADVENGTTLPLYAILRHMDVHVTEFSSVVIEAQSFGVPSVTGEQGVIWFPSQVKEGWALMARSLPEWVNGIRVQLDRREALVAARGQSRVSSAKALDELLSTIAGG